MTSEQSMWPPRQQAVTDTSLCPACFAVLAGPVCSRCGFDVSGPRGRELFEASVRLRDAADARSGIIGVMRAEQAAARARVEATFMSAARADSAPASSAQLAPAAPPRPPLPTPWQPASASPPTGPAWPTGQPRPTPARTRSGVQILLLVAGITLVGVAALFFAVIAYLFTTPEVRAALLALAAVGVGALAMALRRRLPGTAEGLAVLALVFVLVDGLLIRNQGLFGAGALPGSSFLGVFTLVSAALFVGFARLSRLRSPAAVAAVIVPFGGFWLLGGLTASADFTTSLWASGVGAGAATLGALAVWRGVAGRGRFAEAWLRVTGVLGASWATVWAAVALPDLEFASALTFGLAGMLWLACAVLPPAVPAHPVSPGPVAASQPGATQPTGTAPQSVAAPRPWWLHSVGAAGVGVSLVAALATPVVRVDWNLWTLVGLAFAAGVGFVALAALRRAADATPWQGRSTVALGAGGAAFALAALVPLVFGVLAPVAFTAVAASTPAFGLGDAAPVLGGLAAGSAGEWRPQPGLSLILAAIALVMALLLLRRGRRFAWAPVLLTGVGALVAAVLLPGIDAVVWGVIIVGVVATIALGFTGRATGATRNAVAGVALFTLLPIVFIGRHTESLWLVSAVVGVALPLALRRVVRSGTRRNGTLSASALGIAVATTVAAVFTLPDWLNIEGATVALPPAWAAVAALAILAALPLISPSSLRLDRNIASAVAAALSVLFVSVSVRDWFASPAWVGVPASAFEDSSANADTPSAAGISAPLVTVLIVAVVASVAWQVAPSVRTTVARLFLAAVGPLATAAAIAIIVRDAGGQAAPVVALALVVITAAALVLVDRRSPHGRRARTVWDAATALVGVLLAARTALDPDWVVPLVLAVAALVMASGAGEIVRADRPRHHIAWAALPLGVAALWSALGDAGARTTEFYTLPVGILLAALCALLTWRRPLLPDDRRPAGRLALAAGAVVLLLVPSIVLSASGAIGADLLRPSALLLVGLAIGALALVVPARIRSTPIRAILATAALLALAGTGLVRGVSDAVLRAPDADPGAAADPSAPWMLGLLGLAPSPLGGPLVEPWSALAAGALVIVALLWARDRHDGLLRLSELAVLLAVVVFTLPALVATLELTGWTLAPLLAVAALSCVSVIAAAQGAPPFGRIVRWTAAGGALLLAAAGLFAAVGAPAGQPYSADVLTVIAGLGLVMSGLIDLGRSRSARSWPTLGPGLAVALIPPLLADYGATTLVRIVLLGIAAIAVLLWGVVGKLQAPTLIGATVLILHALAQLWPWVSSMYSVVPWWLWAGVGGALLIFVAATYEKRIRNARTIARSIRSLR